MGLDFRQEPIDKLVEGIKLTQPNPQVSKKGKGQGSNDDECLLIVSPTRTSRRTADVEMNTVS